MSYLVLARKWRPRRFAELVGQEHVVRALTNALDTGRVHHAFLFTGTRGVGKTTIARIFAKSPELRARHVGAEPCGECNACRDIDAGRFVDLLEIDAASNTGVDDVRELIDNAQYMPSRGRVKVYLIDEVHMLSKNAFNALLKTLEEPPGHVKFLLATTDPQKLPVTVLSRCLQFNLKRLDAGADRRPDHARSCEAEAIRRRSPARSRQLARAADGSLRDGLSLLDQAIAYTGGQLDDAAVARDARHGRSHADRRPARRARRGRWRARCSTSSARSPTSRPIGTACSTRSPMRCIACRCASSCPARTSTKTACRVDALAAQAAARTRAALVPDGVERPPRPRRSRRARAPDSR